MKKVLSYLGMAALIGAAFIVAGCTRSDAQVKNASDDAQDRNNINDQVASDEADDAQLVPEIVDDNYVALYGVQPVIQEPEADYRETENGELEDLRKLPPEPVIKALYGVDLDR